MRGAQLDKEAAELRDEVAALTTRAKAFDAGAARDFATKAEALRQDLSRAQSELAAVYRDKSKARAGGAGGWWLRPVLLHQVAVVRKGGGVGGIALGRGRSSVNKGTAQANRRLTKLASQQEQTQRAGTETGPTRPDTPAHKTKPTPQALEDLIAAQRARDAAASAAADAQSNFESRAEEVAVLKARVAELGSRLDEEAAARQLAANEAEARCGRWLCARAHLCVLPQVIERAPLT